MTPLFIALAAIVFVIVGIAVFRLHAFFALVLAGLLTGVLGVATGVLELSYVQAV